MEHGRRNGVTDRIYGVDETTGYKWGVYVTDEDPAFDGENVAAASEGAWTKYQYPNNWGVSEQNSKTDSFRYSFMTQNEANDFSGRHYIKYQFELEPGTYSVTLGQQAMWWNGGPFDVVVNGKTVDTYSITSEDEWNTTVFNEHTSQFTIPEGEDSALISLESDSDIWLTHIVIREEAKESDDKQVLFSDDFSEDTSAEYDIPNLRSVSCEYGSLDVNMNSDWDESNGIRRDITEYVSGHSGNENIGENSEKFGEYTDIYSAPWGEASIVLKGATKAKIYYVSGGLDVSGLSEGCDVSVKADQAEGYEYLKGLVCDSEAVNTVYDDEAMTVTFSDAAEAE